MKYLGGVLLLVYVAISASGVEPFTREARGGSGQGQRVGRTGGAWPFFWSSGYRGGK